jgi:hypothetical protein
MSSTRRPPEHPGLGNNSPEPAEEDAGAAADVGAAGDAPEAAEVAAAAAAEDAAAEDAAVAGNGEFAASASGESRLKSNRAYAIGWGAPLPTLQISGIRSRPEHFPGTLTDAGLSAALPARMGEQAAA